MNIRVPEDIRDGVDTASSIAGGIGRGKVVEGLWYLLIQQHSMAELCKLLDSMNLQDGRYRK